MDLGNEVFGQTDLSTARLIIELQLADANAVKAAAGDDHTAANANAACEILESELKQLMELFADLGLDGSFATTANKHQQSLEEAAFDWTFDEDADRVIGTQLPVRLATCTACQELRPEANTARGECGHDYCRECLEHLFRQSLIDEPLYPPRCCRSIIPLGTARAVISDVPTTDFLRRKEEMETRHRTYCHRERCSTFISPRTIRESRAVCPLCQESTCALCSQKHHVGDCPQDVELEAVLGLAEQERWRRCVECKRMVELKQGCNHITYANLDSDVHGDQR